MNWLYQRIEAICLSAVLGGAIGGVIVSSLVALLGLVTFAAIPWLTLIGTIGSAFIIAEWRIQHRLDK